MIGFLVLAGIVVNNGIVFIDCINQLREQGMERKEAIKLTGKLRLCWAAAPLFCHGLAH